MRICPTSRSPPPPIPDPRAGFPSLGWYARAHPLTLLTVVRARTQLLSRRGNWMVRRQFGCAFSLRRRLPPSSTPTAFPKVAGSLLRVGAIGGR